MRKPLFVDRDGVLNVDVTPYVSRVEEFQVFPWTVEALRALDRAGYDLFVISNQQGVAKGITPESELAKMDALLQSMLEPQGFQIRKFYYCLELDEAQSEFRKPAPGMVLAARDEFGLNLSGAFFIGDKDTDMECAVRSGLRPLLVLSGVTSEGEVAELPFAPERVFPNLLEAARWIASDGD